MRKLLLGNEAVARGAYEAGVGVACAYPGTPSTEITENLAKYNEVYCEWSPNEKVALEVAIGASIGGARSICSMKHVGLNVAADPLFTSSYTGVNGGLVVLVADDPGMHSSQNEQDSRHYALASKVPMLEPSDSQECKDFVKKAFEISEKFDTPVIVRLTTRVAHSQSLVEINDKENYVLKDYVKNIAKYVMMPGMAIKRHTVVEMRTKKLSDYSNCEEINKIEWADKDIGVITSGIEYEYAKEAIPNASFLKIGMVNPLPDSIIRNFASKVKKLYVIEGLDPYIEQYVKSLGIEVTGKELFPVEGELSVAMIKEKILGIKLNTENEKDLGKDAPGRPPVLCPGCPHRAVFTVFKKLKLTVTGDIGCYTLGALAPNEAMDTCVCMGASIGVSHGLEKARGAEMARHTVAVLGDSTFVHSGITGLTNIVYNKGTSTVVILDNSITAMTGHQQNPTTGYTIRNEETRKVDLVMLAKAIGVQRIRTCDPFNMTEFEKIVCEEIAANEPSVIIAQHPCALLKGIKPKPALKINSEKCKKCKKCLSIGCPCIVDRGSYVEINDSLCNGCGLCTQVCKFGAIEGNGEN